MAKKIPPGPSKGKFDLDNFPFVGITCLLPVQLFVIWTVQP